MWFPKRVQQPRAALVQNCTDILLNLVLVLRLDSNLDSPSLHLLEGKKRRVSWLRLPELAVYPARKLQ